ncbi:DUF1427 family protein [Streptomyces sp. NPDC056987]|uniref:DUF1427 family protein n=1 Tax=Streptomyces sp. NPDC056987 TaxID=3345988 RepID=UPI00362F39A3
MTGPRPAAWRQQVIPLLTALLAGGLTGSVYWLIHVETPAPPWIALTGLLGMITGETAIKAARRTVRSDTTPTGNAQHSDKVF